VPLDRLVRSDVERAIQAIGGKPNTSESYRLAVSALFTWSIQEERERARAEQRAPRWDVNPASLVESYSREARVGTVSDEDVMKLLTAAEPYQEAYLRAFLHLGLRLGELQHTRLGPDLDVGAWLWRIQRRGPDRRCACPQCSHHGWSPKTRQSVRTIAVPGEPAALREAIRTYLRLYPTEPGEFVFRNPRTDRVWISRSLATDFQGLCERAEVRYGRETEGGITLHTLRHTCATSLIRAGVRESIVAALLGDTVRTVVETYVNLSAEDLAAGVSRGPAYEL
jgi:integrase